jgi:putative FmdB family regulatory protein
MPIYEYCCTNCGKHTEMLKSIKDSSRAEFCAECGGLSLKVMSANTFHLKGNGWAADGYCGRMDKFRKAIKEA